MSQWQDINEQQPPAPAHPGAAGAREWVVRRSAELAGRDAYSRLQVSVVPAEDPTATVVATPNAKVSRLRFWLSTVMLVGFGTAATWQSLVHFAGTGSVLTSDLVVINALVWVGMGFLSSLIFRLGSGGRVSSCTIGRSTLSLLAANFIVWGVLMSKLGIAAVASSGQHFDIPIVAQMWLVTIFLGISLMIQLPLLFTGVGIGCLLTPRKR